MGMILILGFLTMYIPGHYPSHAVYISVVEIEAQQVRVKVFQDDLQNAIRHFTSLTPNTKSANYCEQNRALIESYFNKTLKIKINNQPVGLTYHSSSAEGDSYWISFLHHAPPGWQSLVVEDNHFMELFPTQSNIIKISEPNQRFCRLSMTETKCSFEF